MNVTSRNLDGYGTPPIQWERVRDVLTSEITQVPDTGGPNRHTPWLTTINPDDSPHVQVTQHRRRSALRGQRRDASV